LSSCDAIVVLHPGIKDLSEMTSFLCLCATRLGTGFRPIESGMQGETAMIQLLKSLLNAKTSDGPTRKAASTAMPRPAHNACDFRAVSLAPSLECCAATKDATAKRYLWREAPRLPLPGCALGSTCSCKFIKHTDRRDGDRRLLGGNATNQWFTGSERRKQRGRRAA
jgi:hypothetical protein